MSPFYVSLIVNIFLLLVLIIGFFVGFKRGLKRSGLRLAFFVVSTVLAFFISPLISSALMNIQVSVDGETVALQDIIIKLLSQNETTSGLVGEGSAMAEVAQKLPLVIVNLLVFLILFLVLDFIFWIVYKIVAHFAFKKKKTTKVGEKVYTIKEGQAVELVEVEKKEKKYGWLGGLVSVVQAFFFTFFMLLPISGVVTLVRDVSYEAGGTSTQTSQSVSAESSATYTALGSLINENVPGLLGYLDAYDTSVLPVVTQVGGFQDLCFDGISSTSLNGEKLVLRNEVLTIGEVYSAYDYISKFDFSVNRYADIDFNKLDKLVDILFNSGLIKTAGPDAVAFALDMASQNITIDSELVTTEDVKSLLLAVKEGIETDKSAELLKQDVKALLNTAKLVCKNGIVDALTNDKTDEALTLLTNNEAKILKDVLTTLTSSNSVRRVLVGGINIALSAGETALENSLETTVNLDRVDLSKVDWNSVTEDVSYMVSQGVELYNGYNALDTTSFETMLNGDYKLVLSKFANILDKAQSSKLVTTTVNNTNLVDNVIDALKAFKIEDKTINYYINLNAFKKSSNFNWSNEINALIPALEEVKTYLNGIENFKTYNYNNLDSAISNLFETKIISALNFDNCMSLIEEQVVSLEAGFVKETLETFLAKAREYEATTNTGFKALKSDVLNLTAIIRQVGEAGLIDDAQNQTLKLDTALSAICQKVEDKARYSIILENLTENELMLSVFETVANYGLKQYDEALGKINTELSSWQQTREDLGVIIENLNSVAKIYGDDLTSLNIFDARLGSALSNLGVCLDKLAGLEILSYTEGDLNKNVYDNLLDKLASEEVGNIIDLSVAKRANIVNSGEEINFWQGETLLLKEIVDVLTAKIYPSIEDENRNALKALVDGEDAYAVIKTLSTVDSLPDDEVDDSELGKVISPLISSLLMRNTLVEVINTVNFEIEKLTDQTITEDTSTIIKFTKNDEVIKNIELQKADLVAVFKEAVVALNKDNPEIKDLKPLLSSLEKNAKTSYGTTLQNFEGVFKQGYDKLNDYVNAELKKALGLSDSDNIGNIDITVVVDIADSAKNILDKIEEKKQSGEDLSWEEIMTDADVLTTAFTEAKDLVDTLATKAENEGKPIIDIPDEVVADAGELIQNLTYNPETSDMTEEEFNGLKTNILKILGVNI